MPEFTDLTKDPKRLLQFTADEAEKELSAIEGHGIKVQEGTGEAIIVPFCMECARKHLGYVEKLASECIGAQCPTGSIWQDMRKWASESRAKLTEEIKKQELMSQEQASELIGKARNFRKEMEKIALGTKKITEGGHLT